jgi:hypothetical protein
MSSNTRAPVCKSCQKGHSSNQRRVQRPSYVEEDYYNKYHNSQRDPHLSRQVQLPRQPRQAQLPRQHHDYNNSNDKNQHVCMSCNKH